MAVWPGAGSRRRRTAWSRFQSRSTTAPPVPSGKRFTRRWRSTAGFWGSRSTCSASNTGNLFPAWKGSLFVGGHQPQDLVRLTINGDKVVDEERLLTDLQPKRERIRDVRQSPEGAIYLLTNDVKGRMVNLVPNK